DARLVQGHQQEAQPLVPAGPLLGARDDEDPLAQVRERGPHLLPVDVPPAVVAEARGGGDVGQVRAGVRLRVALRPQLGDVDDPRQEAVPLLPGAVRDEGRPQQRLAEVGHAGRGVGLRVDLVEADLLAQRRAAPAVLDGPADAGPAGGRHVAFPLESLCEELVLTARPARALDLGEVAHEVGVQPGAELRCELVVGHLRRGPGVLGHATTLPSTCLVVWWAPHPHPPRGAPMSDSPTVETTPAALRRAAALWPDGEAVADVQSGHDTRRTWPELLEQVRGFAAGLIARGVQHGDRVVIWAPNTRHWMVAALGVQYAGGTVVPANTRYTGSETLELVQRTDAVAAVLAGDFLGTERIGDLASAAGGSLSATTRLRTVVRIPLGGSETASTDVEILDLEAVQGLATDALLADADARADAVTGDDVADILFTSGTTGRSKGVIALHRQTIAGARGWGANGELGERDRYLIVNPFFHTFGYKAGFLVCVLFGATVIPLAVYSTAETLRLIQDEKAT